MDLVITKYKLIEMQSEKICNTLLRTIESFCLVKNINTQVKSSYMHVECPCSNFNTMTFDHYYRVKIILNIIESMLSELHDCFPKYLSILLKRIAYLCLNQLLAHKNA